MYMYVCVCGKYICKIGSYAIAGFVFAICSDHSFPLISLWNHIKQNLRLSAFHCLLCVCANDCICVGVCHFSSTYTISQTSQFPEWQLSWKNVQISLAILCPTEPATQIDILVAFVCQAINNIIQPAKQTALEQLAVQRTQLHAIRTSRKRTKLALITLAVLFSLQCSRTAHSIEQPYCVSYCSV